VLDGVLLAATLLIDEAAWLVGDPELEARAELGAEVEDPAADEEADVDAPDEEEPEVEDAADVEDRSTETLDRVTEA
jgi:broad specificity phosphatase PhoE